MHLDITDEDLKNIIDGLEKTFRELCDKATSWSFDLEGDYERYLDLRQKELRLAQTINRIKLQRTEQAQGQLSVVSSRTGEDKPLEPWEQELLTGGHRVGD